MPTIRAVVRLRPSKASETNYIECAERAGSKLELATLTYTDQFSAVLGSQSSQADAFKACGLPIVDATLSGRHTCLFAYGQTGSGKTFSMYGAEGGKNPSKLDGVVPAICAEIFRRKMDMEKRKEFKFELAATLIEVAGNSCIDLLGDPDAEGECPKVVLRGSELQGVRLEKVHSSRGLTQLIEAGMSKRKTGQNVTHGHSSRSHAFLTMHLEKKTLQGTRVLKTEVHTISLVDLAGSERGSSEDKAGSNINAGLLALGKVLTALKEGQSYVPYRDNLLTQMLRISLEKPDCMTFVLACINPGFEQFAETRNVLEYVHRATQVTTPETRSGRRRAPRTRLHGGDLIVTWRSHGGRMSVSRWLHGGYKAVTRRLYGGYTAVTWHR